MGHGWVPACVASCVLPCELVVCKLSSGRNATIGGRGKMRLVAGSSAITLKLSSSVHCTRVFKGWYGSTTEILLIFSSVELVLERASL